MSGQGSAASGRLGVTGAIVGENIVSGDVRVNTRTGTVEAIGIPTPSGSGLACPGMIDLQVNGFAGIDFLAAEPSDYATVSSAMAATGVTAYVPTLITAEPEETLTALRGLNAAVSDVHLLGAHLEGPFLSPAQLGTHPPELRRDPDVKLLQRFLDSGLIRIVTLAAEQPAAHDLIRLLVDTGVLVSIGHSDATAAEAHAAFDAGVRTVTHLGNAMRPMRQRETGIIGPALTRGDVTVQLIVDGHHLSEEFTRLSWAAAHDRFCLVTDAVAAAGMGDGTFRLGAVTVTAADGAVRRDDDTLAGSALTMDAAVRNLHRLGISLVDAVHAATAVPARLVGRPELGSLQVGGPADITVLDDDLAVRRVLVAGKELYAA